jgi:hypothetical protein
MQHICHSYLETQQALKAQQQAQHRVYLDLHQQQQQQMQADLCSNCPSGPSLAMHLHKQLA